MQTDTLREADRENIRGKQTKRERQTERNRGERERETDRERYRRRVRLSGGADRQRK